jgi:hypothetical protein
MVCQLAAGSKETSHGDMLHIIEFLDDVLQLIRAWLIEAQRSPGDQKIQNLGFELISMLEMMFFNTGLKFESDGTFIYPSLSQQIYA